MQANITQRLSQRLINKKQIYTSRQNAKNINEELLEMINHIRSLEDQLLAEQYRQELLCEQNEVNNSKLEKLNSRNQMQRQRIAKLEEEYEIHKIKNNDLQICEESLRSIYQEINELTKAVESRAQECEILTLQNQGLRQENEIVRGHNDELQEKQQYLNNTVKDLIKQFSEIQAQNSERPIDTLRTIMDDLKCQISSLEIEINRIQRQNSIIYNLEKEAIIKLQFEYELLKERAKDNQKIEKLNDICARQSNLETVVQEMLVKEDQLIDKLHELQRYHAKIEKNYQTQFDKMSYEYEQKSIKAQSYLRQLKIKKQRMKIEIKQLQQRIQAKSQRYEEIFHEQSISLQMDINLASLKRLREVEERNKYLKLKINEMVETKALLLQEKELLHSQV